jgi:hypothetical protein
MKEAGTNQRISTKNFLLKIGKEQKIFSIRVNVVIINSSEKNVYIFPRINSVRNVAFCEAAVKVADDPYNPI